jgi:hypothetical protein
MTLRRWNPATSQPEQDKTSNKQLEVMARPRDTYRAIAHVPIANSIRFKNPRPLLTEHHSTMLAMTDATVVMITTVVKLSPDP